MGKKKKWKKALGLFGAARGGAGPLPAGVAPADARWSDVVLVCGKCMRKLPADDPAADLRGALRKAAKQLGLGKTVRVIETGCLDVCPKGAVTVAGMAAPPGQLATGVVASPYDPEATLRWLIGRHAAPPRDDTVSD